MSERSEVDRIQAARTRLAASGPILEREAGDFERVTLPARDADVLRDALIVERARVVVEIGLAYGTSALAIAEALASVIADRPGDSSRLIVIVGHKGEFPDDIAQRPAADPAMFGMPALDDGSRSDVLLAQNLFTCTHYQPDFDSLRSASTHIVVAAGVESEGEMANRGAHAVAEKLGQEPVAFPSGHGGFLGGEYGQSGEPDAFAAKLHEVLD